MTGEVEDGKPLGKKKKTKGRRRSVRQQKVHQLALLQHRTAFNKPKKPVVI